KNMGFETPIALCVFNRPDLTEVVFEQIAKRQPKQLFVYSDGARAGRPDERARIEEARRIVERIDWDCDLKTDYSDTNLGCKFRMSSGISWALEQVERVIVLEDDCVAAPSFFTYCETLLDRYEDDDRVMAISGNNFQAESRTNHSYYFSKYAHCWGWATWRSAWSKFDLAMPTWPEIKSQGLIHSLTDSPDEAEYLTAIFDAEHAGELDSWAYAWFYSCLVNNGLTCLPDVNLVSNIGFGDEATHTTHQSPLSNLPAGHLENIKHPPFVFRHKAADMYTFDNVFRPTGAQASESTKRSLSRQLKDSWRKICGRQAKVA
ncbi:MAG: hypothetical protein ACI87E_004799, partial [Mariniblastus sp.]